MKDFNKKLGYSVYPSSFDEQKDFLLQNHSKNIPVFTSLHIHEDLKDGYIEKITSMCEFLHNNNFEVIADIEPSTLNSLNCNSYEELIEKLNLDWLRIDYGMDFDSVLSLSKTVPIVINASTIDINKFNSYNFKDCKIKGMHNFYPRPETGLSFKRFKKISKLFIEKNIEIYSFISGDLCKRGPIFKGLPTLEKYRYALPAISYIAIDNLSDGIFVGDLDISNEQKSAIYLYVSQNIIQVKADLLDERLYNKPFKIRMDNPSHSFRLENSKEYFSSFDDIRYNFNSVDRNKGFVTMDNNLYKRYKGEVQIMRRSLKSDPKVNVLGQINKLYLPLLKLDIAGKNIVFIK